MKIKEMPSIEFRKLLIDTAQRYFDNFHEDKLPELLENGYIRQIIKFDDGTKIDWKNLNEDQKQELKNFNNINEKEVSEIELYFNYEYMSNDSLKDFIEITSGKYYHIFTNENTIKMVEKYKELREHFDLNIIYSGFETSEHQKYLNLDKNIDAYKNLISYHSAALYKSRDKLDDMDKKDVSLETKKSRIRSSIEQLDIALNINKINAIEVREWISDDADDLSLFITQNLNSIYTPIHSFQKSLERIYDLELIHENESRISSNINKYKNVMDLNSEISEFQKLKDQLLNNNDYQDYLDKLEIEFENEMAM